MIGKEKRRFKWVGETEFIHQFLTRLQKELDQGRYDFTLEYWDTCSLPNRCWQIAMEFPEGYERLDAETLESVRDDLLREYFNSKELKKTIKIFQRWMHPSRNNVLVVPMGCVLCDECGKGRGPGVIIYWV